MLVHIFSDIAMAVAIFQAGKGRDAFIQACARELWLTCAVWDITLAVGHVPGTCLEDTDDALRCPSMLFDALCHPYQERVDRLLAYHNIRCILVPDHLFHLAKDL